MVRALLPRGRAEACGPIRRQVRIDRCLAEAAAKAGGCPVTSLVVNSNLGGAKFESIDNWRRGRDSNPRYPFR